MALRNFQAIDAQALLALAYDTVTIKTALTPPIVIDLRESGSGQVTQLMKDVQPAVILSGRAGRVVIAPAGEPSGINPNIKPAAVKAGLGVGAALLGAILIGAAIIS